MAEAFSTGLNNWITSGESLSPTYSMVEPEGGLEELFEMKGEEEDGDAADALLNVLGGMRREWSSGAANGAAIQYELDNKPRNVKRV